MDDYQQYDMAGLSDNEWHGGNRSSGGNNNNNGLGCFGLIVAILVVLYLIGTAQG
ncbi:MAG: hypothetical protein VB100_10920 [Angelakisella sp.]|nr:hypothetical protein [Angelakisella sp.]